MREPEDLFHYELEEQERQAHVSYASKTYNYECECEEDYIKVEFHLQYKIVYAEVVSWTLKYDKSKHTDSENKQIEKYLKNHESEIVDFMVDFASF